MKKNLNARDYIYETDKRVEEEKGNERDYP
jgi:hypothetical protein